MTMDLTENVEYKIRQFPAPLIREILDFIDDLAHRHGLVELNISSNNRQYCDQKAVQFITAFRGSGKGGGTERLLADRQIDQKQEA